MCGNYQVILKDASILFCSVICEDVSVTNKMCFAIIGQPQVIFPGELSQRQFLLLSTHLVNLIDESLFICSLF